VQWIVPPPKEDKGTILEVLYEDEHMAVVLKPPGLIMHGRGDTVRGPNLTRDPLRSHLRALDHKEQPGCAGMRERSRGETMISGEPEDRRRTFTPLRLALPSRRGRCLSWLGVSTPPARRANYGAISHSYL
jgi:hypothetical protein